MRCYQLCLLVSLHTHGLRVRLSLAMGLSQQLVARADTHRRLSTNFMEVAKLVASDAAAGDDAYFGYSVAIDGDTVVVGIGSLGALAPVGSAYVFFRTSDGGATYVEVAKLTAADAAADDRSAAPWPSTAIPSWSGPTSDYGKSGAAYVFRTTDGGATYDEVAKLTASDAAVKTTSAAPWRSTATPSWSGPTRTITMAPARIGLGLRLPHERRRRHVRPGGQADGRRRRGGRQLRLLRGDRRRHHRGWGLRRRRRSFRKGAAYVFRTSDGGATYDQVAKLTASRRRGWATASASPWRSTAPPSWLGPPI